ncbi:head maturation protease [Bacillus phage vB_BanS_Chewbecca]|uniref:ATP-dependent Clp protease proteolytic subunit n=1 Tax=Bacillus phage vB_BanS_Chewbecca TaxID=2894786 RepID=A0AAE9CA68_9CAUD|nr:head maturation protease [Bacillus phage vB_BanS_Chewbecca]UGO46246.1 ATP-dependent Clp protease proteolytic subunit [Bacillus phage vB_BanS_Chewbecca]
MLYMYGMTEPSRQIVISSGVDEVLAKEIMEQLTTISDLDDEREELLKNYDRNEHPIEIFINSGGGAVTDGFAIIGAMEMCNTPIVTYAMGLVGSMALAIFVAGDIRIAHRHARLMYHSLAYGMLGHIKDHEQQIQEADLLQRMYNSLMVERTNFPKEKMEEIRNMKYDYYFSAKEAVQLGVAHDFIKKPQELDALIEQAQAEQEEGEKEIVESHPSLPMD